jgi:hypothetical protein
MILSTRMPTEPVVRIRCPGQEEQARAAAVLRRAGLEPQASLTWLVVRDADPDAVNDALAAGGTLARVAAREQIGKLVGWLIDRQGDLAGREVNVRNLCARVLSEAGLASRHGLRDTAELVEGALALYEQLMATGAGFVSWERFLELFCRRAG